MKEYVCGDAFFFDEPFDLYYENSLTDGITSGTRRYYQIESLLCSITDSTSSNDGNLLRSRLRLGAAGEQILAEVTLRHDCL